MGIKDVVVATRGENDRLRRELHARRDENRDLRELLLAIIACPESNLCPACREASDEVLRAS